ncbi:Tudor domain-containing protein 1 [Holothuria leucospilota]|uniref:Tudor domain-containing protein 1 n=1 Tax=Holothuria leucospilota TaxID=206669 RepID=A0A9Q1H0M0_HOLLE|nr:Tudor domain-containing protein 1 [Holothuria leucospilota]
MAAGCGRCGNLDITVECPDCGGKIRSEPVPLCGECNTLIHEGVMKEHRVETLDAKRKRSDFKERLESFEGIKPQVKFQLAQISKAKRDVESRLQNNIYNIQQSFLEVGKVFKKKEQEFLLQLRSDASSKMTSLQEWHEAVKQHQKDVEEMQELADKVIDIEQPSINAAVSLDTSHLADQVLKLQLKSGSDMKSAPTFTKEIVPLVPPKDGDQLRAYVEGRIDMKGNFWLCPDFVDSVANVLDDLSFEIRRNLIKEGLSAIEVKEGMFCVAEFEEDSRWYRAKVEKVDQGKKSAQVKWMDYAHVNEVPLTNIQVLKDEFKRVPFQALECCLFENMEGNLPREARWEFSDLTGQNCLECTVLKKIDREDNELPLYHMQLNLPDKEIDINEVIKAKASSGFKEKGSIACRDVRLLSKEEGGIKELTKEKIEVYSEVVNKKTEDSKGKDSKPETETKEADGKEKEEEESKEEKEIKEDKESKEKTEQDLPAVETKEETKEEPEKVSSKEDEVKTSDKDAYKAECNGLPNETTQNTDDPSNIKKEEKITILTREKGTAEVEQSKQGVTEAPSADIQKPSQQSVSVSATQPAVMRKKPPAIPEFSEKEEVDSLATMLKRQQQDGRPLMPDRGGFGGGLMNPYMTPNMAMVNPALQQLYGNPLNKPNSHSYPYGQVGATRPQVDQLVAGKAQANMYELTPNDVLNIRVSSGLSEEGTFLALKIRGPDEEGRFRHLMQEISMETDPMLTEDVAPGKLMCAYYSTLNQWCRAHIIDVQDSMVLVWFCDFGTTEAVPSTHIRFLELRHHLFPFQSAEYSIANSQYTYFPKESVDTFRSITADKIIKATVVDSSKPKPQVSLTFLSEVRDEVDVLKELIQRGLQPTQHTPDQKGGKNQQHMDQQGQYQGQSYHAQQQQPRNMDQGPQYPQGPYQSRSQDVRNASQGRNYNNYGGDGRDGYYRGGGGGGGMQQQKPKGGQWSKPKGRNQRKGRYN